MTSRLVLYALRDSESRISEYVFTALASLRGHADFLAVVVPDDLRVEGPSMQRLVRTTDAVWESADEWHAGHTFEVARLRMGRDQLASFDEVLYLDDSSLGLIGDQLPEPEASEQLDGWVLARPDSLPGAERAELSYLLLRGETFTFERFWSVAKQSERIDDLYEALTDADIRVGTVYQRDDENDEFLIRDSLQRLIVEGLPIVPWHALTIDPLFADRWGIVPSETYEKLLAKNYPAEVIWQHLLANVRPRVWYTNLAMAEILTDDATGREPALRTAIIMHVFYVDMLPEMLTIADHVPGDRQLVITTDTAEKRAEMEALIEQDGRFADAEVRVVTTNRGRDISAFILDCADILRDESIDLVVKLHSKRSVQDPASVSSWFRRHLFGNLLPNSGYAKQVYRLFEDEPQLGMVFPPTIHQGLPTLGHAWTLNLDTAMKLRPRLGITTPFDETTPLSPYGSMFIARREALESLLQAAFTAEEFPDGASYRDGSMAHALERLISYSVISRGYYIKTVQSVELAEISSASLEYKLQEVARYLPPYAVDQAAALAGVGEVGHLYQALKRSARHRVVRYVPFAAPLLRISRPLRRWVRARLGVIKRLVRGRRPESDSYADGGAGKKG